MESVRQYVQGKYQDLLYPGKCFVVDPTGLISSGGNRYSSVQDALTAAKRESAFAGLGANVLVCPGDYDEVVSVSELFNISVIGLGPPGGVAIAPSGDNDIALTLAGTDNQRMYGVSLANIGCEGDGTGGGLKVHGNVRRFRSYDGKYEGGAFALTLESTAEGSVGDTRIIEPELCWTVSAMKIVVSGGGDPVTQCLVKGGKLHNYTTDGVVNSGAHTADLWLEDIMFANNEDASEPTQYLDIDEANTTGHVKNCYFATTVLASAKLAIAAGVIWLGNRTEAENPGTAAYGTDGRPD